PPAAATAKPTPKPAATPAPAVRSSGDPILDARLIVAWRMNGAQLEVRTISAREIASLTGKDAMVLVPWVLIAYQTGQVFLQPGPASPTLGEKLVTEVVSHIPADLKARLPEAQVQALGAQTKSLSHQKFLLALIAKAIAPESARDAG